MGSCFTLPEEEIDAFAVLPSTYSVKNFIDDEKRTQDQTVWIKKLLGKIDVDQHSELIRHLMNKSNYEKQLIDVAETWKTNAHLSFYFIAWANNKNYTIDSTDFLKAIFPCIMDCPTRSKDVAQHYSGPKVKADVFLNFEYSFLHFWMLFYGHCANEQIENINMFKINNKEMIKLILEFCPKTFFKHCIQYFTCVDADFLVSLLYDGYDDYDILHSIAKTHVKYFPMFDYWDKLTKCQKIIKDDEKYRSYFCTDHDALIIKMLDDGYRMRNMDWFYKNSVSISTEIFDKCMSCDVPLTEKIVVSMYDKNCDRFLDLLKILAKYKKLETNIKEGRTVPFYVAYTGLLNIKSTGDKVIRIINQINYLHKIGANFLHFDDRKLMIIDYVQKGLYDDEDYCPSMLRCRKDVVDKIKECISDNINKSLTNASKDLCTKVLSHMNKLTYSHTLIASQQRKIFGSPSVFRK